jgi:spore cortex biosynthesis protein YabQ
VGLRYQIWVMALAVLGGFLIALFYDIYWLVLAHKRRPRWLRAVEDLLFWLAVFCAFVPLWLYATAGALRLAVYLWLGWGAFLWRITLSRPLRRLRPPP